MSIKISLYTVLVASLLLGFFSCKKEPLAIPPSVSEFIGPSPAMFFVTNSANSVFKIPVGVTAASSVDRTINFTVSSPTGAKAGTQYSITKATGNILAGAVIDSIPVTGIYSGLAGSRKDTLVFTLSPGGGVEPSSFAKTFTLVMQRACTVVLPDLAGIYNKAVDMDNADPTAVYPPYSLQITSGTTTGTKGFLLIDNLWDAGAQSTRVELEWTGDVFTTTINDQFFLTDPTYGNVRIKAAGTGTFSPCDKTFVLKYEIYVPNRGTFGAWTTTIAK